MNGSTSYPDYDNLYIKLDSLATEDELLYLASKGSNVIKYHINTILVDRKSTHLADLFTQYLFNQDEIHISMGCMGSTSSLAASLYSSIFYQNEKIESVRYNKEHYTPEELKEYYYLPVETKWTRAEVDSLLTVLNKTALSNDNVLPVTLKWIFENNTFKFENYERVRYFANKYPEKEILATLASFQNKNDLPLLHKNSDNAFIAISKFPDKFFIPVLKARFGKPFNNDYYNFLEAATSFCSTDAEELLTMIVAQFDSQRDSEKKLWLGDGEAYYHFYSCLEKRNCSVNDEFLLKLWLTHRTISLSFFDKIKEQHYGDILKGYLNPFPIDFPPSIGNLEQEKYKTEYEAADGYLCPIILNYLKDNSSLNKDKSINLDTIECKG